MDTKNLPQKTIAEYVSGAKDMENRLYVLHKLRITLAHKKIELREKIPKLTKDAESYYMELQAKASKTFSKSCVPSFFDGLLSVLFGMLIVSAIGGFFVAGACSMIVFGVFDLSLISYAISVAIVMSLLLFLVISGHKKELREKRKEFEKEKKAAQECLPRAQLRIKDTETECNAIRTRITEIDTLINATSSAITQTSTALSEYYQAGIIPPDYRNAACVEIIDYVFRNDQADTMREATLLCNQYQWHGELMDVLRELGSVMVGINNTLNNINNNISMLSADIEALASGQRELAKETKLTRYAAESTAKSAEYLEWRVKNHIQ